MRMRLKQACAGEGANVSQHHPGRRHRVGRRTVLLLAPALVGGLILTSGPAALATSSDQTQAQPADAVRQEFTAGTYLVQLADEPVATYAKTAAKPGRRLNTRTEAVGDYADHLNEAREKVLDVVNGVRPLYSYRLLLNGFAAKLTARQAGELARTPGVVSLTRNVTFRPATENTTGTRATTGTTTASHGTTKASHGTTKAASATGTLPPPDTPAFLGLKKPGGLYSKIPVVSGTRAKA